MNEVLTFITTIFVIVTLILLIDKKRKKISKYERTPIKSIEISESNDWQKLDLGLDPSTELKD